MKHFNLYQKQFGALLNGFICCLVLLLGHDSFGLTQSTSVKENMATAHSLNAKIDEEQIQFSYSTSDGGFQLNCTHWPSQSSASDWQIVCGKGTPTVKEFFVHLYIDEINTDKETKYIVFYSIHDRNHKNTQFSSHFTVFRFSKNAEVFSFEQALGIENDAAYLNLSFKR